MKKLILFAAILFAGISTMQAQNQIVRTDIQREAHTVVKKGIENSSDETNLTVTLNPILSVSVNTTNINLEYTNINHYQEGVRTDFIKKHLNVYSTGGFDVTVRYQDPKSSYGEDADASSLFNTIQIVNENGMYTNLSTEAQQIASASYGGFDIAYNIDYRGKGGLAYRDYIQEGKSRTFDATVVYEITPK